MTRDEFQAATGLNAGYTGAGAITDHLPCFAHRWRVNDRVNTPELIQAYVRLASETDNNDVLVFSITEQDKCWAVWKQFHRDNPKFFKMVQGGSIHGQYLCRMYIYTKSKEDRKFSEKNIGNYRAR